MKFDLPVVVGKNLSVSVGETVTHLTPTAGIRLAERLLRVSTRRLVQEEAELATRASSARKPVAR